jgi:hypothetical protein
MAGLGVTLILVIAGCVLIDSWFQEDAIDPDGEGPEAPIPSFEIPSKYKQIEIDADPAPLVSLCVEPFIEDFKLPSTADSAYAPPRPRPVDPAGWLGRRHFRSPT